MNNRIPLTKKKKKIHGAEKSFYLEHKVLWPKKRKWVVDLGVWEQSLNFALSGSPSHPWLKRPSNRGAEDSDFISHLLNGVRVCVRVCVSACKCVCKC